MTDDPNHDHKRRELVHLFREFNNITSQIQIEMSKVLVADESNRKQLEKHLRKSENEMEKVMEDAAFGLIAAMPLATMNRCNMICRVLALHSNLTGDTTMHDVFDEITEEVLNEN